jgi:gamma-glutamyltranspeptidase / glutathione hydrolase
LSAVVRRRLAVEGATFIEEGRVGWKKSLLFGLIIAFVVLGTAGYRVVGSGTDGTPPPQQQVAAQVVAPVDRQVSAPDRELTPSPEPAPPAESAMSPKEELAVPVPAYGVNAGHPAAVDAGMAVLDRGGNAVDAAIAAAYAVGVAEPFGSGIGGGGAALVVAFDEEAITYDYRDVVNASGTIPASDIGIPGFVAGMEALHAEYGTIDLAELIDPAIRVAEDGVEAYQMLADQLRFAADRLPVADLPHLYPGGRPLQVGDLMVQTELAETLRTIAAGGSAEFYRGEISERLASVDGIDLPSLASYEVKLRAPVAGTFGGYEVLSAPPPLAGATLVQMLQIAEAMGAAEHEPGSPEFVHALAMGWRAANHYRTWELADPDFVDVPTDKLTDADLNTALAAQIPADGLLELPSDGPLDAAGGETTHLTVVDADGTMVAMTNTLTNIWGSGRYELGFMLNDQLGIFGGQHANQPAEPGKRAVSSTVPTIVLDTEGRPVLGLGSPGGSRIPAAVANVVTRWALHGETLVDAVAAPRFHLNGRVLHLEEPTTGLVDALRAYGYDDVGGPPFSYYFGSVQALEVDYDAGEVRGTADHRRAADWRAGDRTSDG